MLKEKTTGWKTDTTEQGGRRITGVLPAVGRWTAASRSRSGVLTPALRHLTVPPFFPLSPPPVPTGTAGREAQLMAHSTAQTNQPTNQPTNHTHAQGGRGPSKTRPATWNSKMKIIRMSPQPEKLRGCKAGDLSSNRCKDHTFSSFSTLSTSLAPPPAPLPLVGVTATVCRPTRTAAKLDRGRVCVNSAGTFFRVRIIFYYYFIIILVVGTRHSPLPPPRRFPIE